MIAAKLHYDHEKVRLDPQNRCVPNICISIDRDDCACLAPDLNLVGVEIDIFEARFVMRCSGSFV